MNEEAKLGLATTIDLIRELAARAKMGGYADYRTVNRKPLSGEGQLPSVGRMIHELEALGYEVTFQGRDRYATAAQDVADTIPEGLIKATGYAVSGNAPTPVSKAEELMELAMTAARKGDTADALTLVRCAGLVG